MNLSQMLKLEKLLCIENILIWSVDRKHSSNLKENKKQLIVN